MKRKCDCFRQDIHCGWKNLSSDLFHGCFDRQQATEDPTKQTLQQIRKNRIELATADGKQPTVNMTVTNTYLEELNLKITKMGRNTTEELLSGVEFKLEKKNGEYLNHSLVRKQLLTALPPLQNLVREPTD